MGGNDRSHFAISQTVSVWLGSITHQYTNIVVDYPYSLEQLESGYDLAFRYFNWLFFSGHLRRSNLFAHFLARDYSASSNLTIAIERQFASLYLPIEAFPPKLPSEVGTNTNLASFDLEGPKHLQSKFPTQVDLIASNADAFQMGII